MNTFKLHSTQKVKLYLVDWVEFYLLGGILPRDHLVAWLSGDPMNQQGSPSYHSFLTVTSSYHGKVTPIGALFAEKI